MPAPVRTSRRTTASSNLLLLRPLFTVNANTLADGGRVHDLFGARGDPYVNRMLTGVDFDFHWHSNLVRATLPYELTES